MKTLASLSLGSRLRRLSDLLFAEVAVIYEQMGLTLNPNYFLLLNLINEKGSMGITQAAERLSVSHPAVSKLASKMIKEGYLIKAPHPSDKRASQLSLTEQSSQIIQQAAPIWQALKKQLDYLDSLQGSSFLTALDNYENNLQQLNLANSVLQELRKSVQNVEIINWHPDYKADFKQLNMSWLNSEFNGELTGADKQSLHHPESFYLSQGGYIFFAKQDDKVIGCIALKPSLDNGYEISKMAVAHETQGLGIGRKLLLKAIDKARELQVSTLCLETNSGLLRAMALYQHVGFTKQPHPKGESEFQRADIYMELQLYV